MTDQIQSDVQVATEAPKKKKQDFDFTHKNNSRANPNSTRLWPREKAVLKRMSMGEDMTSAVEHSYNMKDRKAAGVMAAQLKKRQRFIRALEAVGLTDQQIAESFKELALRATRPVVVDKQIYDYPDNATRLGATKAVANIKGYYRDNDNDDERKQVPLIVQMVKFEKDGRIEKAQVINGQEVR